MRHMKLNLSVDDLSVIQCWVGASDRTHWDCKGRTGAMMSLGKGAVLSYPGEKNSTPELELVGADTVLTRVIWSLNFIESLGYTVNHNIMYQDNQSTMRVETNEILSSSKRTKHIHARYFFIADKIATGGVEIWYCPTAMMLADVLNEPKRRTEYHLLLGSST